MDEKRRPTDRATAPPRHASEERSDRFERAIDAAEEALRDLRRKFTHRAAAPGGALRFGDKGRGRAGEDR
jgi:hypothetical protein